MLSVMFVVLALSSPLHAGPGNSGPNSFTASAPAITFTELPIGSENPSVTRTPAIGDVTVSFSGTIRIDNISDSKPGLSGPAGFMAPISVTFSQPVVAVGIKVGYFDSL